MTITSTTMATPNLQPCPLCGSNTVDKATCLHWHTEPADYYCVLRRYRCALRSPATPSAAHDFTEGQSITVEGIQGPYVYLNGTYGVDSASPDTITP